MKSFNSVKSSSFNSMNIARIKTAAYKSLVKRLNVTTFAIIITKMNRLLKTARNKSEDVNLQELSHEETLKEVKAKLSSKYHDYLDVFDWAITDQLFSHRFYDHKIELIDEKTSSWSHLYHMSDYKCYDSSYAPSLMTMLMTMLVTILRAIADRSSLEHRLVPKSILFRVSLCSSESYR